MNVGRSGTDNEDFKFLYSTPILKKLHINISGFKGVSGSSVWQLRKRVLKDAALIIQNNIKEIQDGIDVLEKEELRRYIETDVLNILKANNIPSKVLQELLTVYFNFDLKCAEIAKDFIFSKILKNKNDWFWTFIIFTIVTETFKLPLDEIEDIFILRYCGLNRNGRFNREFIFRFFHIIKSFNKRKIIKILYSNALKSRNKYDSLFIEHLINKHKELKDLALFL